jgi:hypothetical protein
MKQRWGRRLHPFLSMSGGKTIDCRPCHAAAAAGGGAAAGAKDNLHKLSVMCCSGASRHI